MEFIECDELIDHKGNKTAKEVNQGLGCVKVNIQMINLINK